MATETCGSRRGVSDAGQLDLKTDEEPGPCLPPM